MQTFNDHNIQGVQIPGPAQQRVFCPECTPTRKKQHIKDLCVNIIDGVWNCKHCDWSGGLKNKTQQNIAPKIKKTYKNPIEKPLSFNEKTSNWLSNDRGISKTTQEKCNLSFESAWMPQTKKDENCVVFNYYSNNKLINRKYRTGAKHHKLESGSRLLMYYPIKEQTPKGADTIIITEGEIDCISIYEAGYQNIVSIPNGAPPENVDLKSFDMSYLETLNEIFTNYKKVILAMDNDFVGARCRDEIARRIGYEKCLKVEYPDGCKDINDVLIKYKHKGVKHCINTAAPYPISGLYSAKDFDKQLDHYYNHGFEPGVSTGYLEIDSLYTPRVNEFTIVTGIPSHGKSTFIDNVMINISRSNKWKFGIFSPENFPFERHISNLIEIYIGKPFQKKYSGHMDQHEMIKGRNWVSKYFNFIMPKKEEYDIDDILKLARAAIFRHGINGLVIDPWNEIEHNRGQMSETDYISKALSKIRKFARVNGIHIWVIAHPAKMQKKYKPPNEDKNLYPMPGPYDISGSAHWRNKADNCICVYRDFNEDCTLFASQKIRFKECGKVGESKLHFNIKNSRFRE